MEDWINEAANRILNDLLDRKGVGNELENCDDGILKEIKETISEIIKESFEDK
jgi:hypothetical protein